MYFVAEAGINHNGSLSIAKQLIDIAVQAGCDCIKFQKRTPKICVPKHMWNQVKETLWGNMTYIKYKKKLEFGKKEYDEIDKYCKQKGIRWSASVWDIPSFDFIIQYNVPFIKIPSAKITDIFLIKYISQHCKIPICISTGMSTEKEIDKCIHLLKNKQLIIMHCNSSYPANDNELNLKYIEKLKKKYGSFATIGYSGHEEGISACIVAKVLDAEWFERHITLSRSMLGTDQAASLVYDQLYRLVRDLKKVDTWLGNGIKKVYLSEELVKQKLR